MNIPDTTLAQSSDDMVTGERMTGVSGGGGDGSVLGRISYATHHQVEKCCVMVPTKAKRTFCRTSDFTKLTQFLT